MKIQILFSIFFLGICSNIFAQQYSMKNFSSNVVGHSQVYALVEDSRGFIWMGTWGGGLTRFDGENFYTFSEKDNLLSIYINALYEDRDNNIWIGSKKGLSKFDGQQFQHFFPIQNQTVSINKIVQDDSGLFWIGTNRGLFQFNGKDFIELSKKFEIPYNAVINACYIDSKSRVWIGSDAGAFYFKNGSMKKLSFGEEAKQNNIQDIIEDKDGNIWFASTSAGIHIFDGKEITRFQHSDRLEEGLGINTLFKDLNHHIWIGMGNQGVYIWNSKDSLLSQLIERDQDGLESDNVKSIIQDHWGDFWLGTSGGSLSKYFYSDQQFTNYTEKDGLIDKEIYAICRDSIGKLWLGTSRGISIFDGKSFFNYSRDYDFADIKSRAIFADRENRIWIGTEGKGLALYDGTKHLSIRSWDGLKGDLIQDILQDSSGNIWVAMADAGIARIEINEKDSTQNDFIITQFGRDAGLKTDNIYDLHLDRQNRIWYASRNNGIGYWENDSTIVNFVKKDGLPALEIRTLTEDHLGNLWGGTANSGIFKVNIYEEELSFQTFNQKNKLSSNNIYLMAFDAAGKLWLGNQAGVDQVELNASHSEILQVNSFRSNEGFQGGETCESAILTDDSGTIWFGTIGGLTLYTPGSIAENKIPPNLHFTNISLSYDSLKNTEFSNWAEPWGGLKDNLILPYFENNIGFEFIAINHQAPDQVSYSWLLQGMNNEWSPKQKETKANYTNLAPGDYTFKVRAYNEDQFVTPQPIELKFTITPPFWATLWFRFLAVALGLFIIFMIFNIRIRQVRRKARREAEKLEMEKNLLELEQKALQLQMNPHFIFNALNTIQSLINEKDHKKARYQLAKFSKLMRATLENSRETLIPLEDEIQSLENYLTIEQMSRNNSFDYKITTAEDIDPEAYLIPPMMIQPFVENAIIHGVAHISDKGVINVNFSRKFNKLIVAITDNGIGREKAKALKSQMDHNHKSTALQVTQERLDILNKGVKNQKSLEILDIKGQENLIIGTKIILRLPIVID